MNIDGVDTVFYWVTDIDRALGFYTSVFGIEPGPRHGDWQVLQVPGPVAFALHAGGDPATNVNAVVSLRVPNLDQAIRELAEKGHNPVTEITDTGAARFAGYEDPDGNLIDILERTI